MTPGRCADRVRAFVDSDLLAGDQRLLGPRGVPAAADPEAARSRPGWLPIQGYGCPASSRLRLGIVAWKAGGRPAASTRSSASSPAWPWARSRLLGIDEQKARWLPAMARPQTIGVSRSTEPNHGLTPVALETTAAAARTAATVGPGGPQALDRQCRRRRRHRRVGPRYRRRPSQAHLLRRRAPTAPAPTATPAADRRQDRQARRVATRPRAAVSTCRGASLAEPRPSATPAACWRAPAAAPPGKASAMPPPPTTLALTMQEPDPVRPSIGGFQLVQRELAGMLAPRSRR